ncbi:S10 family peptidase [Spelaeicoccus albus]|uniref:Carboxypeptidase C (Cathepsin A) n=1 Tax=Spelaeicoccus albus TaxID=1280376 RepID=A0A7Z0ABF8_9MICO|nr:peptidase S10 [Spelaeicoccus albus]NYI67035.1 carboxypeptidase C (cathepsin A) [Spelaeicoccus albus]
MSDAAEQAGIDTSRNDKNGNDEPAPEATSPTDDVVTTRHVLTVDGEELAYTATAGRIVIREEEVADGVFRGVKPKAELFVVSYVADDTDTATRPVTFIFNGGPGSPSLWLHLGLFGPRRIVAGDVDDRVGAPFELADNPESLLAQSDLVFIDPLTTGYSRAADGVDQSRYHGYSSDRDLVGEVIRLWTSRNDRWLSPKFLAGESYGTLRAAALAGHLTRRHGMTFNGVVLLSSILNMGTAHFTAGNDAPYVFYLPTYAAMAHYHGKHPGRSLADVVAEAREFAEHEYAYALLAGNRLDDQSMHTVAGRLAALIGVDVDYVIRARLRVEHTHFFAELLRAEHKTIGRLDGRFVGDPEDLNAARSTVDPSYTAIQYPYTAAANHYYAAELGYRSDLPYEILTDRVHPWSYSEFENASATAADDLAYAMRTNPDLQVYVAYGYYDGATPFAAAEHVFANLAIPARLQANITGHYFESGHMMYIHDPARRAQSRQIADFVRGAGQKRVV